MRVKDPELHGKIAKKIIKYVLLKGNKLIDVKEEVLSNVESIVNNVARQ